MPVTAGAQSTEANLNATTPAAPANSQNVAWQASAPYPDPNNPGFEVRDVSASIPLVDTDGTLAADSDARIASQKATKTYVDALAAAIATDLTEYATQAGVQAESYTYAADTGAANAYAIAPTPVVGAYAAGQGFAVKIANANTGASTLNVSTIGAKTLKKWSSGALVDLSSGDLSVGQIIYAKYDGTYFQVIGGMAPGGSGLTTPVSVPNGGTGGATLAAHGVLIGEGSSPVAATGAGTAGQILTSNGASADPTFQNAPSGFTAGGDLSGSSTSQEVVGILSKPIDGTTPANQDYLQYSSSTGKWELIAGQPFDVVFSPNAVLGSGAIYDVIVFARTVVFAGNFAGAQGRARIAPGTTQTITVNKNGSSIGQFTITSGGVFTFTTTGGAAETFNAGDYMTFTNQPSADTSMVMQVTLTGTRS